MLNDSFDAPVSINNSNISLSLAFVLFIKYSFSPVLYIVLFICTSSYSIFKYLSLLSNTKVTDANDAALLLLLPVNITSLIAPSPRSCFTDCSPKTHLTASTTLLLPEPLGPTIPDIPFVSSISIVSANDLKPLAFISFKYILSTS